MSAASIAAEFEGVGGQPLSAPTIRRTLHQIGLHGCRPRRKPLLTMMHKKARKQFAEDKQTKAQFILLRRTYCRSLRREAQACAETYAVPDVHLSKYLTARQFYADRKRCDWSARTLPSVCT